MEVRLQPGSPLTLYQIRVGRSWKVTWFDMAGHGLESFDHTSKKKSILKLESLPAGDCNSER